MGLGDAETGGWLFSRDEFGGCPEDCPSGIRYGGGANLNQALVRNVRTCRSKGEIQAAKSARIRVPMRSTGTEQIVVGMKAL
jgi:hypothetical protein